MKSGPVGHPRLERMLGAVLRYGTGLASGVIALGLALAVAGWPAGSNRYAVLSGMGVVTAGIALLILLPVLRVALMLAVFLFERDYRYAAIAALVLTIISLGFIFGVQTAAAAA